MTTFIRLRRRELSIGAIAILAAFVAVFIPSSPSGRRAAAEQPAIGTPEFQRLTFPPDELHPAGHPTKQFLEIMGSRVGRSTLFGIPLQQQWSHANSGDFAPTYYLHTDAPLYYYSFTDAYIASVYRALPQEAQARFDPMITGFNPADMYGVDHIRRVLTTFPGVFTGIGEFSIHKEFVSAKIAGETASLTNPALDRILDFAAEAGLVVILHNDIDMPFGKVDTEPVYLTQMKDLLKRHPKTHDHLGPHRPRADRPSGAGLGGGRRAHADAPRDPRGHAQGPVAASRRLRHLVGRSGEVRGLVAGSRPREWSPSSTSTPTGSSSAPTPLRRPARSRTTRSSIMWAPVWKGLTPEASRRIRTGNYERMFDEGRRRVRAWEAANVK